MYTLCKCYFLVILTSYVNAITIQDQFQNVYDVSKIDTNDTCMTNITQNVTRKYKTQCAALCQRSRDCSGFSWSLQLGCNLLHPCQDVKGSLACNNNAGVDGSFYKRMDVESGSHGLDEICGPDGTEDSVHQTCTCSGGLVGKRCERYATSCREIAEHGYPAAGMEQFYIKPPRFCSARLVKCSIWGDSILTFIAISKGESISFKRAWEDYVYGFEPLPEKQARGKLKLSYYWIGLELLHYFTSKRSDYILDITVGLGSNGKTSRKVTYKYYNFTVNGPVDNYSAAGVQYTDEGHPAYDGCLNLSNGTYTPFSTPDRDNDFTEGKSCAQDGQAGWWFTRCTELPVCNPFGSFYAPNDTMRQASKVHLTQVELNVGTESVIKIIIKLEEPYRHLQTSNWSQES